MMVRCNLLFLAALPITFWILCSERTRGAGAVIREVAHTPPQPKSGDSVTVTAQVTNADPSTKVSLQLQVIEPGQYVRKTDRTYERSWREFPMHDDGRDGDARASDGIFSVTAPGDVQKHRRLIRYFVSGSSPSAAKIRVPAATNDCPNFAWFVHDGPVAWTGATKPGSTPPMTFSPEFLATLPTYHLIANTSDVEKSQWDQSSNRKMFLGTMVYDGRVYDHIQFHNRGQASTYLAGKNKWGFRFNPGQEFQARDLWGRKYQYGWVSFNLNACASPWAQVNRGMAGMDEAVSYRAYQLAGVPSPNTHWVHFRVVDMPEEAPRNQYAGDLWGLYLVVQDKNGTWLRESGLPDGNIFSAESGPKHIAPGMAADSSDWQQFMAASMRRQSEQWWREHFDLPAYYSFHAINGVVSNVDLRHDGNHYLYHPPKGPWIVLPHDLDMMFIPKTHWPGIIHQTRCLQVPVLRIEYANRAREILDLFCSDATTNGGQIGQLVAEFARVLRPPNHARTWPELDVAMWNWHPRNNEPGQFYITPFRDQRMGGQWRRTLASPDFAGYCRYMVEFCTDARPSKNYAPNDGDQRGYGFGFLQTESKDELIPTRPSVRFTGLSGFRTDQLIFQVAPFASPNSNAFAAVQWRIAQISAPGLAGYKEGEPCHYEIESHWITAELTKPDPEMRVPPNVCQSGRTYRLRVRYKDNTGRWSRWSEPVQFVAGHSAGAKSPQ